MSEEESEHNEGSQSEEAEDHSSEVSPGVKTNNSGAGLSPVVKKSKSNENNQPLNLAKNVDKTTIMKTKTL